MSSKLPRKLVLRLLPTIKFINDVFQNADLVVALNIPLTIPYLMQDASKAESSALHNSFPTILMCYFHVKENFKKNMAKYLVPRTAKRAFFKSYYLSSLFMH